MSGVKPYVIYVCAICGSDNIEVSTENDSLCGECGEWMNCESIAVVPTTSAERMRAALEVIAKRHPAQNAASAAFYRCREDARNALRGDE